MRWARAAAFLFLVGCGATADSDSDGMAGPLEDPAFAFCHDDDRDWDRAELEVWCPLLEGADPDACPGFRAACAAGDTDESDTDLPIPDGGCGGGGEQAAPPPPRAPVEPPPPPPNGLNLSLGEAVGQIVRWTVALVVAGILVGLVLLTIRALMGWRRRVRPAESAPPVPPPAVAQVPDAESVPDAPSGDLLAAARRAHGEGRFEDAVLYARAAALRALGDGGFVRLHSSRTDREYVRGLRRDRERQTWLRVVVNTVERLRWGGAPIASDQAAQALNAATRLVGVVLVALGLWSLPSTGWAGDYDPEGDAALLPLFESWGYEASWRLRTVRSLDDTVDVLVLDPNDVYLDEEDGLAVRRWVEAGGVLVVAGSLESIPELGDVVVTAAGQVRVSVAARAAGLAGATLTGGPVRVWDGGYGDVWSTVAFESGEPAALVQALSLGDGGVVGISEDRLFTNGALVADGNAALLAGAPFVGEDLQMWRLSPSPRLELATIGGEASSGNPLGALANARLLPLVLQLLLVLALVGLWRGLPFGPLRDPPAEGRIRFADHAVALGRRFQRTRSSRYAASRQAELWLRRLGPLAIQAAAERDGYSAPDAEALVRRAQALAASRTGDDPVNDFKLVEELWRITKTT